MLIVKQYRTKIVFIIVVYSLFISSSVNLSQEKIYAYEVQKDHNNLKKLNRIAVFLFIIVLNTEYYGN